MATNGTGLGNVSQLSNVQLLNLNSAEIQSDITKNLALSIIQEGQVLRSDNNLQPACVQYPPAVPSLTSEDAPSAEFLALFKDVRNFAKEDSSSALQEKISHLQSFENEFSSLATKIMKRADHECLTEQDYKNLDLVLIYIQGFTKLFTDLRRIEQEIQASKMAKVKQHAELLCGFEARLNELQAQRMASRRAQDEHEQKLRLADKEFQLKEEEQKHKQTLDFLRRSEESRLREQQELAQRPIQNGREEGTPTLIPATTNNLPPINLKSPLENFIPRVLWIEKLEKVFLSANQWGPLDPLAWIVLYGLGGVGKSELACYFANKYINRFSFVCWIDCDTEESRQLSYKELAKILKVTLEDKMSIEKQHQMLISRLEKNQFKLPWLLILDNANSSIQLPQRGGFLLATSNQRDIWPNSPGNCLEMDVFTEDEALTFVKRVTGQNDEKNMRLLVRELDFFPLAIDKAVACIYKVSIQIAQYLERMNKADTYQEGTLRHPKALMKTWQLTLEELRNSCPLAFEWLNLAAHFNHTKVPKAWLREWLAKKNTNNSSSSSDWEILKILHSFSLIQSSDDRLYFSMHPLMQEIIRLTQKERRIDYYRDALNLLIREEENIGWQLRANLEKEKIWLLHAMPMTKNECFPYITGYDRGILLKIIGLIQVFNNKECLEQLSVALVELQKSNAPGSLKDRAECVKGIGLSHFILRNYHQSLVFLNESLRMFVEFYQSDEHPEIAHCLVGIGISEIRLCHYEIAIDFFDKAIEKYKKNMVAVSHHYIARCLQNKAIAMEDLGCKHEIIIETINSAIENYKDVHSERVNPLIVSCLIAKGRNLVGIKHFQEAFKVLQTAMKMLTEIFQEVNHPLIASCLTEMGRVLIFSQPREALEILQKALKMYNVICSEEKSLDISICLSLIAQALKEMRCLDLSLVCCRAVLKINQDLHKNIEHISVASAMFNVGMSLIRVSRYEQSLKCFQSALQTLKKIFENRNNFLIADCLAGLALNFHLLNQNKSAVECAEEAMKMYVILKVDKTDPRVQLVVGLMQNSKKSQCIIV